MSEVIFPLLFLSFLLEITCTDMEVLWVPYGLEKDVSSNAAALRHSRLPVEHKAACNQGATSFCNDLERINNEYIAGIMEGFKRSPGKRICIMFQFYTMWSWRQWSISVLGTRCSVTHWSGLHVWCADRNNPKHSHGHLWITNWAKTVFSDELLIYSKFRIGVQLTHNLRNDTYCSEGHTENWKGSIWLHTHLQPEPHSSARRSALPHWITSSLALTSWVSLPKPLSIAGHFRQFTVSFLRVSFVFPTSPEMCACCW